MNQPLGSSLFDDAAFSDVNQGNNTSGGFNIDEVGGGTVINKRDVDVDRREDEGQPYRSTYKPSKPVKPILKNNNVRRIVDDISKSIDAIDNNEDDDYDDKYSDDDDTCNDVEENIGFTDNNTMRNLGVIFILFVLLSQPSIKNMVTSNVPFTMSNSMMGTIVIGVIFVLLYVLVLRWF